MRIYIYIRESRENFTVDAVARSKLCCVASCEQHSSTSDQQPTLETRCQSARFFFACHVRVYEPLYTRDIPFDRACADHAQAQKTTSTHENFISFAYAAATTTRVRARNKYLARGVIERKRLEGKETAVCSRLSLAE